MLSDVLNLNIASVKLENLQLKYDVLLPKLLRFSE